jgi:putative transposase
VLHEERFMDKAPAEVYARLLDEAIYLCSIRTMYRILHAANEVKERRNRVRHPAYSKPELLATGPNQVWSWDITKLKGPAKWQHYCLYVIIDIFSRCVVGWMIAERESETLAKRFIADTLRKHGIKPGDLVLHADRGAAMTSKPVAQLLADLGVTKTHSRPHTSNDNPYSEAHFKTLKYRPDFPERFGSIEDVRSFCRSFFRWYNHEHYHSGIALLTPASVHLGRAAEVIHRRSAVLEAAYEAHPERFVTKKPSHALVPTAAWINPPTSKAASDADSAS